MAYVLAASASPRLHGFTAGLLAEAVAGAASVPASARTRSSSTMEVT